MKSRSRCVLLTAFITLPSAVFADPGAIVLVGKGSASSAPEYVSFSVAVKSICYASSQEAASANAKVANDALKVLESFKTGDRDKVTASGGANVLRTETTQVGDTSRVLCEMKWRAENYLEIQMANITSLPDLQDKVVRALNGAGSVDHSVVAQTYADIGMPVFNLYPETTKKLRDVAQGMAFDDAKSQLEMFRSHCAFVDLKLVNVSPEYTVRYKLAGESVFSGDDSGPIVPDEMEITADLRMQWAFTPSAACIN